MLSYFCKFERWVLLSSADFSKLTFSKNYFNAETTSVSNILDPDQAQRLVGPDLGSNCLQRLSADDKSHQEGKS